MDLIITNHPCFCESHITAKFTAARIKADSQQESRLRDTDYLHPRAGIHQSSPTSGLPCHWDHTDHCEEGQLKLGCLNKSSTLSPGISGNILEFCKLKLGKGIITGASRVEAKLGSKYHPLHRMLPHNKG